jgi:hypothetical protein
MNRHERISHLYRDHRRYSAAAVTQALAFETTRDALGWLVEEFSRRTLDWRTLRAGSPYPIGLPNFVRIMEEAVGSTLEFQIHDEWPTLTAEQRQTAALNFVRIFGQPELLQGANERFCRLKFARWLVLLEDGRHGLDANEDQVEARAAEIAATRR